MSVFVRKNIINFSVVVTDAADIAPTNGIVKIDFPLNRARSQVIIDLAAPELGGTAWTSSWDSSASDEGQVYWTAYFSGAVQAAQQGFFSLSANPSNDF